MKAMDEPAFSFAGFTLDLRRGCLRSGEREIELRPKSFEVLRYLVENAGRLVPKDEVVRVVWPNVFVSDESLTRCISEVRLALGDDERDLIKTVPRRGYLFAAPVEASIADGPAAAVRNPATTRPPPSVRPNTSVAAGGQGHGWLHQAPERRHVTVLCCDLAEAAALAAQLDLEDLQKVLATFHAACAEVVARFDGMPARPSREGVLAYFGIPRTHEHDVEQAVRAGLGIVKTVARALGGLPRSLHVRIGIATGVVLAGDSDLHDPDHAVVGEAPHLAFRLKGRAEADTVLIAASTRRLVGDLFECTASGSLSCSASQDPIPVYRVSGEKQTESRFKALRQSGVTRFVGREHEIALLLGRWRLAKEGDGQVMLLAGEPGIGKSRMVEAVGERLPAEEPYRLLRHQCWPQLVASPLHPVIARLEHDAGFRREDAPEIRLAKLMALLDREVHDVSAVAPLLAALMTIPTLGGDAHRGLTPPQQKAKTLEALVGQLETMAARCPVFLVFEDLHWADPTTLEFLDVMVERTKRLRMLAVFTFRPGFTAPWTGHAHVTLLSLNRLGRRDATTLAEEVGGGKSLPSEVLDRILARTDGVPLYVEEVTKAVLESGVLEAMPDGYALRGLPLPLTVPSSLHDSLLARLDRLASLKDVAQLAACIGREFSHEMLAGLLPLTADALAAALEQLEMGELIHRVGTPSAATYAFRHALLQEAAYHSVPRSRRRQFHAEIARTAEARSPEIAARQPEWLAHHYSEAGLPVRAFGYWVAAARRAKARYSLREAATQLEKSLDMESMARSANAKPSGCVPASKRLDALVLLGDVASMMGDLDGANRRYEEALGLAHTADARIHIEKKRHRPHVTLRGGARIVFYEHGGGEATLLFVSPIAYGLAAIQPVLERLCQAFRVVTIDPRGSGASDPLTRPYRVEDHAKDVRAVIAALGDRPVVGVGISAGANVLLRLAHAEPRLFSKLVTLGAPPSDFSPAFHPSHLARHAGDLETLNLADVVRSHTELVYSEPEMRELREQTIRSRLLLPRETVLSFFDPDPSKDVMPLLAGIRLPTLVAHGREDRIVAFTAAGEIAAGLPNAQLFAFEGKGHLPIFTATDAFCEVLTRFVRAGAVTA